MTRFLARGALNARDGHGRSRSQSDKSSWTTDGLWAYRLFSRIPDVYAGTGR
jgi:hypothetical protein